MQLQFHTMASSMLSLLSMYITLTFSSSVSIAAQKNQCHFQSIYQFGDSLADVGNMIRLQNVSNIAAKLPYGETNAHNPTGRYSDGLLMIDYIATAFKLPLLNPYKDEKANVDHGVDFAVAGSTALDTPFFHQRNVQVPKANTPLSTQITWFSEHLKRVCSSPSECAKRLEHALIFLGEIGGNDYNYALRSHKSLTEMSTYVPKVVQEITNAAREVIQAGAVRIIVPGIFPMGCLPIYVTGYTAKLANSSAEGVAQFDDLKCVKGLNEFSRLHNRQLDGAIGGLRKEFPEAVILYGDYFGAFESVLRRAPSLGFDQASLFKQCCGTGSPNQACGMRDAPVCPDPALYISWDGVHLTQQAYKYIAELLLDDVLPKLECA